MYRIIRPISRRTLTQDLCALFVAGQQILQAELQEHCAHGGQISLTTNTWLARNYRKFTAVTVH
jgi:hypothetical protein